MEQPFPELQCSYAVLDNDPLAAEALASLIKENDLGTVLWTSSDPGEARRLIRDRTKEPDVLVLDMSLGTVRGTDWCQDIRRWNGRTAVLIVTAFPIKGHLNRTAMAGAQGIASKTDRHQLVSALKMVARGGTWSEGCESAKTAHIRLSHRVERERKTLTPREQEALNLRSKGMKVSQIATRFGTQPSTVGTLLGRARGKLGADTISEAVAIWQGIDGEW